MFKVFISSNQTEFEKERQFIKKEFEADYFLKSFFKVFLFEDSPSLDCLLRQHTLKKLENQMFTLV